MLAMSPSRRLISAALPAPSTRTRSASASRRAKLSSTALSNFGFSAWYSRALAAPRTRPCTTTCAPISLCGLSSTGFMWTVGATPQARACSACARPISPPSCVTAALFDMFCGLNGRTAEPAARKGGRGRRRSATCRRRSPFPGTSAPGRSLPSPLRGFVRTPVFRRAMAGEGLGVRGRRVSAAMKRALRRGPLIRRAAPATFSRKGRRGASAHAAIPQNSMPSCARTPAAKWCLTRPNSVTQSAASTSSGLALRPVTTTCSPGLRARKASTTSASGR